MIPTEPQTTDLLSYVNVPGAIDLHNTYQRVWHRFSLWSEGVAETKIQISEIRFNVHKTMKPTIVKLFGFFFFNYTCIYNRKFMRFIILQLDEFTCTIYPTVLFFFYRFSSWPWLVRIIPDQQIPLWFVIISVKSTPHSFKPFHLKLFRIYYITLDVYR